MALVQRREDENKNPVASCLVVIGARKVQKRWMRLVITSKYY